MDEVCERLGSDPARFTIVPGAVDTDIWDRPGNDPAHFSGALESPDVVAARIVEAILASQRDVLAAMPRQTPPPDVPAMPAPVAPQTLLPPPPKATSAAKSKPKVASVSPPAATPAAPAGRYRA